MVIWVVYRLFRSNARRIVTADSQCSDALTASLVIFRVSARMRCMGKIVSLRAALFVFGQGVHHTVTESPTSRGEW